MYKNMKSNKKAKPRIVKVRWTRASALDTPPRVDGHEIRYWSYDALVCLEVNGKCTECEIPKLLEAHECKLRPVVITMIDKLGLPTQADCRRVNFDYERLKIW